MAEIIPSLTPLGKQPPWLPYRITGIAQQCCKEITCACMHRHEILRPKHPSTPLPWLSQGAPPYWAAQFLKRATVHPIRLLKQLCILILPTHIFRPPCLRDCMLVVEAKILLHFTFLVLQPRYKLYLTNSWNNQFQKFSLLWKYSLWSSHISSRTFLWLPQFLWEEVLIYSYRHCLYKSKYPTFPQLSFCQEMQFSYGSPVYLMNL